MVEGENEKGKVKQKIKYRLIRDEVVFHPSLKALILHELITPKFPQANTISFIT